MMAVMGRPKARLEISDAERQELERFAHRRKSAQGLALRARVVLLCDRLESNRDVAEDLGISEMTVGKWRRRFVERRLEGLLDAPRVGAPRQIGDDQIEQLVQTTLQRSPKGRTHWSRRALASEMGMSASTIGRIWKAFGLQPHRTESFSLSRDPQFVAKVRDVVGLYLNPPENALVLCVDEKSQIQALDRGQPVLPMLPHQAERRTHNYIRHGTTSLFAALDVATGHVIGKCFRKHRAKEFLEFLRLVDESVPEHLEVHVILDNYATHKTPDVKRWLIRHARFHLHFTPTHASWLNMVESWFSLLSRRVLRRGVHRSTLALERAIRDFLGVHNEGPRPFVWTKSADEILANLQAYLSQAQRVRS
jgi:transposase